MEFTLLGAAVVAVGSMWAATRVFRQSVTYSPRTVFEALLNAMLIGLVTGRIWSMIGTGTNPLTHLGDAFIIRGGVDPIGATIGALAATAWSARRHGFALVDAAAAPALVGLAGWHGACVVTASCLGAATSVPWAMTAPGSAVGRHPVELYAALLLSVAAWVVGRRSTGRTGSAAAAAMLAAAGVRFITEPLRLSLAGSRLVWYGIGVAIGGVALLVTLAKRRTEVERSDLGGEQGEPGEHDDGFGEPA